MTMMTLGFIEKRIAEQKAYIGKIMQQQQDGKISMDRSMEIIKSAMGTLEYFEKRLSAHYPSKAILEEIDDLLARFEDFTHGKDGEEITKLRGKINKFRVPRDVEKEGMAVTIGHQELEIERLEEGMCTLCKERLLDN